MAGGESKAAEKSYLASTGGRAWELAKPFSPPGHDTFEESLELLHDFVVAMRVLQPAREDRVLDLGAGAGWCSHMMRRLNRRSVAVDIAHEMLRVARSRATAPAIAAVAGDMERLPFLDGSFDKAVCLSALHHVPDMSAAVAEIARVLSVDGVAVFSEPGVGHSQMPESTRAVRDFGVLEQEVLVEPFTELCVRAGFKRAFVCPIAYVIPEFRLQGSEWLAWRKLAATKRPARALGKIWRALRELAGVGKAGPLFEEAFAMRLVRLLRHPVDHHPFVLAMKSDSEPAAAADYRAELTLGDVPRTASRGDRVPVRIVAVNTGNVAWSIAEGVGQVNLGVQLLDSGQRVIDADFVRHRLSQRVPPGERLEIVFHFAAPREPGDYFLKVDLVAEGITWFEQRGSPVVIQPFSVT